MMILEAIKGYSTDENVVFLAGDTVKLIDAEEGVIFLEGVSGWCNGTELSLSPKIVTECFKYLTLR